MSRFIVVVVDSFGIGYMDDVPRVRPKDIGANTCRSIFSLNPNMNLQNFEYLGIINALGERVNNLNFSKDANYGSIDLAHHGGDTFMGHQEIMGTIPKKPLELPFVKVRKKVEERLKREGYSVKNYKKVLIVEDKLVIGDNLEADLGQVYNISASFDHISFDEVVQIGEYVREEVEVARVIAFGGDSASIEDIKGSYRETGEFGGIDTPKSGIYKNGFKVVHLGYGIDHKKQVPYILNKNGIKTFLFGKVADIVHNRNGTSYEKIVDTDTIFSKAIPELKDNKEGFFCINIQETDLAGHSQDVKRYVNRLELTDKYLGDLMKLLEEEDILVVTADHGNDPTIGHSKHTREKVPLLLYKHNLRGEYLGKRKTLADIGASVLDFFTGEKTIGDGRSFLEDKTLQNIQKNEF